MTVRAAPVASATLADDMVFCAGGVFTMGSDHHYPEERPAHVVAVPGFRIDRAPVTNAAFALFVARTGYVTLAERARDDGEGASWVFRPPPGPVDLRTPTWWSLVPGATWRTPEGPASSIEGRAEHPVVHVAWPDALAYAKWAGKRLPNEAEWEYAARGGLDAAEYAWGDTFAPDGHVMANIWSGDFPWRSGKPAGAGTEPVGSYPANGYGLVDMIGNVWEWTSDLHRSHAPSPDAPRCCGGGKGSGPPSPHAQERVVKGGSYLCTEAYCFRYRPAARQPQAANTSASHIGFRCARSEDLD